jgi:alkanesulfonate monooxygenase SsuD/methylene tetrahydromethanopterin reductase-like flavin-dependent oxidoreductase (luciferase family)
MAAPRQILVGLSLVPNTEDVNSIRELTRVADQAGLDLLGIQDHPYQVRFIDTFALMATLLAETTSLRIFPDVANLPLRPPAVLAKTAASLDLLSGGRFELGLGAGAFWDGIEAMGGPRRTPGESVEALEEAIQIIRLMWSGERSVSFEGRYYRIHGVHPGPQPLHDIGIWVGAYKPRMLRLVGRLADGWIPSLGRTGLDVLREAQEIIDEAAEKAGREPRSVRRLLNVGGAITRGDERAPEPAARVGQPGSGLSGPPGFWHELLGELVELGFEAFVFWPTDPTPEQVERLATEVAPDVRLLVPAS